MPRLFLCLKNKQPLKSTLKILKVCNYTCSSSFLGVDDILILASCKSLVCSENIHFNTLLNSTNAQDCTESFSFRVSERSVLNLRIARNDRLVSLALAFICREKKKIADRRVGAVRRSRKQCGIN